MRPLEPFQVLEELLQIFFVLALYGLGLGFQVPGLGFRVSSLGNQVFEELLEVFFVLFRLDVQGHVGKLLPVPSQES